MLYICWGFSVSSAAEDKDAVLKWLEFVTSTENEVKAAPIGNIPARFSALASEELQSEFEWMKDFSATIENCIPTPIVPLIPEGGSIVSGFIAPATSEFITGLKSAKDALDNAAKGVYELMEENGYYD
jgi:multiple sugar transport system substrate-binding protein